MSQRRIEYISIDEVVPATFNPKKHDIDQLILSFGRFGFTVPILFCERKGQVAAGNGRLEALKTMRANDKTAPDGVSDNWDAPIIMGWQSANDGEFNAYLAADNQNTIGPGWETESLALLLNSLDDLDGTGFAVEDLDRLAIENAKAAQDAEKSGTSVNFDIVVECDSSLHREEVMSLLTTEGLKVRER